MNKKYKLHNIQVFLPTLLEDKINNLYSELNSRFNIEIDSFKPHICIFSAALENEDTDLFINTATKLLKDLKPFQLTFSGLRQIENKYIFLELDDPSNNYLESINQLFVQKFEDRLINMRNFYELHGINLSSEEKTNIKNYGSRYVFNPHLTIAKVTSLNANRVYEFVDSQLEDWEYFITKTVYITKQDDSNPSTFPTIAEVKIH